MNSDLLDEYCDNELGHKDWDITFKSDGSRVVTFYAKPRQGYLPEEENDD